MEKHRWFETTWHQKMVKALQVNGKGDSTRDAYVRAMRMLVEHYDKTPDKITEDKLQDYFIYRQDVSNWAPSTMRICYTGIKFFYLHVLKRDWHLLTLLKTKYEKPLPSVLSKEEVRRIFSRIKTFHNYAFLSSHSRTLRAGRLIDYILGSRRPSIRFAGKMASMNVH